MVAIQVRDVPDDVREALTTEAQRRGQSLQVFLQDVLAHEARMARNRAWIEEVGRHPIAVITGAESAAELIRRQREERTQHLVDLTTRP